MTTPKQQQTEPHWHEYSIGLRGEAVYAVTGTLIAYLIGLGATLGMVFAVGLLGEEGIFGPQVSEVADQLARVALLITLVVASLAAAAITLAMGLRQTITARALADAARAGADRQAVPPPQQLRHVHSSAFGPFVIFIIVALAALGLALLTVFAYMVTEEEWEIWPAAVVIVLLAAGFAAALVGVRTRVQPAHQQWRGEISTHWNGAEGGAWRKARRATGNEGDDAGNQRQRISIGRILTMVSCGVAVAAVLLLVLIMIVIYPDPETGPDGTITGAGERASLSEQTEELVAGGLWTMLGLVFVAAVLLLVGNIIEAGAHTVERDRLWARLGEPDAERPSIDVLRRNSARHPARPAQVLAALAGSGTILSGSLWFMSAGHAEGMADFYRESHQTLAPLLPVSLAGLAVSLVAFALALIGTGYVNAKGRQLRQALMERWPVRPDATPDSEGNVDQWRKGPVLGKPVYRRLRGKSGD